MRPFSIALTVLGLLLATPGFAQEVLTNQLVVDMLKAGLSERVVVAKIRTSPTNFDTGTDALIALKKNGVPEKVIEAMMSPTAGASAAPAPPAGAPPAASVAAVPPGAMAAPARPTVFHVVAGKEVELMVNGIEIQTNRARYAGRSTEAVIAGNKSKYRTQDRQPTFVLTAAPNEMPLVRLDPGKNDRNLKIGSGSSAPYAGGSTRRGIRSEDLVEVDVERDSRGFYRVRPRAPLAPGEYGFAASRGGTQVSGIYDFGVD
jgi:hypothetical protein